MDISEIGGRRLGDSVSGGFGTYIERTVRLQELALPLLDVLAQGTQEVQVLLQSLGQPLAFEVCERAGHDGVGSLRLGTQPSVPLHRGKFPRYRRLNK